MSKRDNYNTYMKAYMREYRKRNPHSKRQFRKWDLMAEYGLTLEEWDQLLIAQAGLCKLCQAQLRTVYVDHCHKTGRVRGLLCPRCNTMLGGFEGLVNELGLEKVQAYLL